MTQDRVLDKLTKLKAMQEGEAALGNSAAAEAFAQKINQLLLDNELSMADVEYAASRDKDPVIEVELNFARHGIEAKRKRIAWQQEFAHLVADAHLCKILVTKSSNKIWFVGTKQHATTAEYTFGVLVRSASEMCDEAYHQYGLECGRRLGLNKWVAGAPGYKESWLTAFIHRIAERFREARKASVAEAPAGESQALMRLSGALQRVDGYLEEKYKDKKPLNALDSGSSLNGQGWREGKAAADSVAIDRRGINGGTSKGSLKA